MREVSPELASMLRLLPEPALLVESTGRIVLANAAAARLAGGSARGLAGEPLQAQLAGPVAAPTESQADSRADSPADSLTDYLRACARSRQPLPGSLPWRSADGGALELRCDGGTVAPATADAPALLLLRARPREQAVAQFALLDRQLAELAAEVAHRKQAELAARASETFALALVESSADCVKTLDPQGRLLSINAAGQALLEIDDLAGLVGTDWTTRWHSGPDREAAREAVATAAGGEVGRFQGFHPSLRGRPLWWDVIVSPVRDDDGQIRRLLAISRDITEQKRAEQLLIELDRRRNQFLATLAHELRGPLAPLVNAHRLLARVLPPGGQAQTALEVAERQLHHLTRLIDDLLDASRITQGKVVLRPEPLDLVVAVRAAVEAAQPQLDAHRHRLHLTLPAQPVPVVADATRLAQVFGNLITNAVKYTPDGGCIRVAVETVGPEAQVSVADNGIGIPPEALPQVFELFVQVEPSFAHTEGGLGIGLAVARQLVEQGGGSIRAESEGRGRGSRFVVRLPLQAHDIAPAQSLPPGRGTAPITTSAS